MTSAECLTHRISDGIIRPPQAYPLSRRARPSWPEGAYMTQAIRQIYWNIGEAFGGTLLYLMALAALAIMTWAVLRDIARWRRGRPDARISHLPARLIESLAQVFGQKRVLRDRRPGSMHALIFFGFLALFIGTDIIAVEEDFTVPLMGQD